MKTPDNQVQGMQSAERNTPEFDWRSFMLIRVLQVFIPVFILLSVEAGAGSLPGIAQIKLAAEKGDANAQCQLGDAYSWRFQFSEAVKWYRLSAQQGQVRAQFQLGEALLTGKPAIGPGTVNVPANPPEGIQWLLKAAHQGYQQAQMELGNAYCNGKGVAVDQVEAYKWWSLATRKNSIMARVYLDQLILKMNTAQIAEGQKRVESFRVGSLPPTLRSPLQDQIVLKGVTGTQKRRLAIINNETFSAGEEGQITVGGQFLKIRCLEVGTDSAMIAVGPTGERVALRLGSRP